MTSQQTESPGSEYFQAPGLSVNACDTEYSTQAASKVKIAIARIKAAFPIAPFVAPHTNGLKKSGRGWFTGHCPFHKSEKRTFWVNPAKGLCGCFVPGCQGDILPMDVINFYARLHDIDNTEAVRQLVKKARGK